MRRPEQRESRLADDPRAFAVVLRSGVLGSKDMPIFAGFADGDVMRIEHALRQRAMECWTVKKDVIGQ